MDIQKTKLKDKMDRKCYRERKEIFSQTMPFPRIGHAIIFFIFFLFQGHDRALIFTSTKEACLAACLNEVIKQNSKTINKKTEW